MTIAGAQSGDTRRHDFFIIDNEVVDDYRLNPYEGWLYCVIVRHLNQKEQVAFPSLDTLADEAGMSRPSVIKYLKSLIDRGLIRYTSGLDYGQPNVYELVAIRKGVKQVNTPSKGVKDVNTGCKTGEHQGVKQVNPNNTNTNNTNELDKEPPNPPAPESVAVAPSAQVVADPQAEREPTETETAQEVPRHTKAERDALYDALAEHLFGTTPRSPAASTLGYVIGKMISWSFGKDITVRVGKEDAHYPGCVYPVEPGYIPRFTRDYRRDNPTAKLPTTLPSFIKHFSLWLEKQASRPVYPPTPVMSDDEYARAIQRQILGGEVAS